MRSQKGTPTLKRKTPWKRQNLKKKILRKTLKKTLKMTLKENLKNSLKKREPASQSPTPAFPSYDRKKYSRTR